MTLIERLRGLDADQLSADEMIELRQGARALEQEYLTSQYEVPEWLRERATMLDRELKSRRADAIRKRLKELDAQELSLESQEEKRKRLREERERLTASLV